MTLRPVDASGSQRFASDGGVHTGDVRALVSPPSLTLEGPYASADYIRPLPVKGMPGLFYAKVTLHDARGPVRQEGDLRLAHCSRASGTLVCDAPDFLRLPHITTAQASPDPSTAAYRMVHANFQGNDAVGYNAFTAAVELFRGTSSTDPAIIAVAGFPPALTPARMLCLRVVDWLGVSYLMAGYLSIGTAAASLQAITNLTTNPPTVAYVPTVKAVHDMIQLPDGTLMLYTNSEITMVSTAVAPAAAVLTDVRASLPYGGYFAGLQALGGGRPLVYAVAPQGSNLMVFDPATPGSLRGTLKAISLDGWTVQDVNMGLPWVTFATCVRDAIVACDQTSHVFNNGRRLVPCSWIKDRSVHPGYEIICRGHYTDGQRFWWKANEVKSGAVTYAWDEEVHFDLLDDEGAPVSLPCSEVTTLGVDEQTVGGWDLPYFPTTRVLVEYSGTSWYRQKQTPNGQLGYNRRKQTGGAAGSGDEFAASASLTWAIQQYPGLEGCPMLLAKITAPPNRHIATGQQSSGYTTEASVRWEEVLSGLGATFHARGPNERRPERLFPGNRSWSYGFQPKCTMTQQTGGTDPTRYTSNGFPVTYEFFAFKDGLSNQVPSIYRGLDATAVLRRFA